MNIKAKAPLPMLALAISAAICFSACSSSDAPPLSPEEQKQADDAAKKKEKDAAKEKSSYTKFFDAIDRKLDKTRISGDNSDMYRRKSDEHVIFHKERRSEQLIEKNESVDPSYYK